MIHLHIGRNKAASTTLQDMCVDRHLALRAAGVRYLNFGHLAHSRPDIAGCATGEDLAAWVRSTGETVLVSNEFMFGWPAEYTWAMARALEGLPVQVHAYVRDYRTWLPSLYAQDVKLGDEQRPFDAYADAMAAKVSAWPMLQTWGEAIGWGAVRVRTLDPEGLHGGDVVSDLLHALGLDPGLSGPAPRRNASPGWMELELIRACRGLFDEADWRATGRSSADALAALLVQAQALSGEPTESATRYMTADRAKALGLMYRGDLAKLSACTGHTLATAGGTDIPVNDRAPVLSEASPLVLQHWAAAATRPDFVARCPGGAALATKLIARFGLV